MSHKSEKHKHRERLKNHYMNQESEILNISIKKAFAFGDYIYNHYIDNEYLIHSIFFRK